MTRAKADELVEEATAAGGGEHPVRREPSMSVKGGPAARAW
jgi:hypothetical protein